MKEQEAMEQLKTMYPKMCKMVDGRYRGGYDNHDSKGGMAIDVAIKALEKQMPKKPKIVEADMGGMDMETGEEYTYKIDEAHCSACDSVIGNEYDCFDDCYCSKCGQKIDWSCWK